MNHGQITREWFHACDHKFSHRDPKIAAFKGSHNIPTVPHSHINSLAMQSKFNIFTARNEIAARQCFYTCLSVILFTGGGEVSVLACTTGHMTMEVSVQGVSLQGVSVRVSVPGGLCQGVSVREILQDPHAVMRGQYAFYWNAFLLLAICNILLVDAQMVVKLFNFTLTPFYTRTIRNFISAIIVYFLLDFFCYSLNKEKNVIP